MLGSGWEGGGGSRRGGVDDGMRRSPSDFTDDEVAFTLARVEEAVADGAPHPVDGVWNGPESKWHPGVAQPVAAEPTNVGAPLVIGVDVTELFGAPFFGAADANPDAPELTTNASGNATIASNAAFLRNRRVRNICPPSNVLCGGGDLPTFPITPSEILVGRDGRTLPFHCYVLLEMFVPQDARLK
jgi:hypothetical protein